MVSRREDLYAIFFIYPKEETMMNLKKKLKTEMDARIQKVRSITCKDVLQFAKDCVPTVLYIGGYLLLQTDLAFASETSQTVGITPLNKPLKAISEALTGPIPILVTGGGIALGGMSWAMGWEQQAVMRGVKVAGGGAIAMGAGEFMSSTVSDNVVKGLLF